MYFGRIPRFSPSFSPRETLLTARELLFPHEDAAEVAAFEAQFAAFIGSKYAVMVPSARYAFYLLLEAMGIGEGDEVVIPSLTYFAIPAIGVVRGVKPVFADVGLRSHVLDPEAFEAAITPKTKAVVPTHLYGTPCDMDAINTIAKKHGVAVIEDCAQSTGARYKGARVGSLGKAAYYTFGLTKNITTLSGAMITTNDSSIAEHVRTTISSTTPADMRRNAKEAAVGTAMMFATHPYLYPWTLHPVIRLGNLFGKDPIHEPFGEPEVRYEKLPGSFAHSRPRAIQAEVGKLQLERIEALNGARIRNGRWLDEHLAHVEEVVLPDYPVGAEPIYMSFVIHHPRRDALMEALRKRGVDTTVGYMNDCSDHPLFPEYRRPSPNAARIKAEQVHLPVHPRMDSRDLKHLAESLRASVKELHAA
jgi:dTDP-4-amino-4,6-dideoxygalactose transaminase